MRILFKTGLVCFLSIFLFYAQIEAQAFAKLNGPYGGGGKVYEGKNGVLFQVLDAGTNNNILYKSTDGGLSWKQMPTAPAHWSTPIVLGQDQVLYCADVAKLYKSTNEGQSWVSINWPGPGEFIENATAIQDGTLFVAASNSVYRSVNNGQDWQKSSMKQIEKFYHHPQKEETYAISQDTLFISRDKGLSWQVFYIDDFGYSTDAKDFLVASDGSLLVSGAGFIWKFNAAGNFIKKLDPFVGNSDRQIDMALSTTGRLFAFEWYKSFYSDDLGETWVDMRVSGYTNDIGLLAFASTSSGVLFAVKQYGGLFRSTDNGKSWKFCAYGMTYSSVYELDFISDSKLLALTNDGLFYSDDNGQNWTFLIESHEEPTFSGANSCHVVVSGEGFYFVDYDAIYYFKDWKSSPVVVKALTDPSLFNFKLFINSLTGSLFYGDFYDHFYKSTDKGNTWTQLQFENVQDLYTFPDGSLIATEQSGIYKSTDDGENWNLVFSDGQFIFSQFTPIMGNTFSGAYIIYQDTSNYKLASTIDFGTTWTSAILDTISLNASLLYPDHGQAVNNLDYFYVAGFTDEIYRSVDEGRTFNILSTVAGISGLQVSPSQKLYALTSGDGLYRTTTSTSSTKVLHGNVFLDSDKNCDKKNDEKSTSNRLVQADNGASKEYGYTRKNGNFSIPIENGNYQVNVVSDNNYWNSCDKTIPTATYNLNDTLLLGLQVNSLCPYMKVDLQHSILRRCFESTVYITYSNSGTLKAVNAFVEVALDPFFEFISSSIPFASQNGNVYRFLLGAVDENASGSFTINVKISCDAKLGQIHCAEAHIFPDSSCVQTSRAIIRTNANCIGDSIDLIIRNDGNKAMTSAKNWFAIDESNSNNTIQDIDGGSFYLGAGQVFTKRIVASDKVLFMAEQDDSYPYNKLSQTEINSCKSNPLPGSPDLSIINEDEEEPYLSKFCEPNRGSFDPNEITGFPEGITDNKYIDKDQQLEYIIRFQNTGTDTAFNVRVENPLPTKQLDLATLSLGASSHPYEYLLSPDGRLIITFKNISLPDSNINEKTSHGFIQYSIKPLDKLSNGTKILNDAQIYFDFNEAVNTNVDLHTIGSPIPVKVNEIKQENEIYFQIKPNPMQESSTILINAKAKNEKYKLSCLDVYSKQLWEMDVRGNRAVISKGDLSPGVYLLILKTTNGLPIKSKKIIVE